MADSSIGRTPDFGSGGSRFEPWSASQKPPGQKGQNVVVLSFKSYLDTFLTLVVLFSRAHEPV